MTLDKAYNQWFFNARDPHNSLEIPYGTTMLYQACADDADRFAVAERIMRAAFVAGFEAGAKSDIPECEDCADERKSHDDTRASLDRALTTLIRISENAEACLNTMTCAGEADV